jgi:hypothetical protein
MLAINKTANRSARLMRIVGSKRNTRSKKAEDAKKKKRRLKRVRVEQQILNTFCVQRRDTVKDKVFIVVIWSNYFGATIVD